MDDADEIILESLRQFGCGLNASIRTLAQFTVDDAIKATIRCLNVLGWMKDASSTHIPVNTAAKFRLCSQIAQTIKLLGYDGEIGYQSFLYLTDHELRRIFSFLLGKLPRDHEVGGIAEGADFRASICCSVKSTIKSSLAKPWLPWYCRAFGPASGKGLEFSPVDFVFASDSGYRHGSQPLSLENRRLLASFVHSYRLYECENDGEKQSSKVLHLRQKMRDSLAVEHARAVERAGIDASSMVFHGEQGELKKIGMAKSETAITGEESAMAAQLPNGEAEQPFEDEMESLEEHMKATLETLGKAKHEVERLESKLEQAHALITSERTEVKEKEDEFVKKKRTFELVPDAFKNVEELTAVNAVGLAKLEDYEVEWKNQSQALLEEISMLRTEWMRRHEAGDALREELSSLQAREVSLDDEKRSKAAQIERLTAALKHRNRDANRSIYTQRIFEIVGNIKKQCREIEKVLEDTRVLQKSINMLEGKLDRSFTIADELIFRDAKKDDRIRRAYKNLAALREGYDLLISTVRDIGAMTREIRDLEDQVEQDKAKNVVSNLEGIQRDFAEMKAENAVLREKLESQS